MTRNLKVRNRKTSPLPCHSDGGFTLLELLISLVMIGVMALIITGAMRLGVRSVSMAEKKIDSLERTRTSFHIIDSQVQSQVPLSYDENGEKRYYFQGEKDYMQFATNYSIWGGQEGYVVVRYKVEPDNAGKQLMTVSENIVGISSSREARLFSSVDAIRFEYYFKDPTEEKGQWVEKWTDNANIPEKIKLHLVYGEKDIPLIIPMRTAGAMSQTALTKAGGKLAPGGKAGQPKAGGKQVPGGSQAPSARKTGK